MTTALSEAHEHSSGVDAVAAVVVLVSIGAVAAYAAGMAASRARSRSWPPHRLLLWTAGVVVGALSIVGPIAEAARDDFVSHAWAHLLGAMIAPILLVLSAPVTLALRGLEATPARRLSRVLRSMPLRLVSHPLVAGALNVGGLWVLYSTPLLEAMHRNALLHLAVHAHLLLVGFLFTAAVIGIDPAPHAPRRPVVAVALVLAMAGHGILAKQLYAAPPASVPLLDAQEGAQLMYYAGAVVETVVVVIFCARWYRVAGRRGASPAPVPRAL